MKVAPKSNEALEWEPLIADSEIIDMAQATAFFNRITPGTMLVVPVANDSFVSFAYPEQVDPNDPEMFLLSLKSTGKGIVIPPKGCFKHFQDISHAIWDEGCLLVKGSNSALQRLAYGLQSSSDNKTVVPAKMAKAIKDRFNHKPNIARVDFD